MIYHTDVCSYSLNPTDPYFIPGTTVLSQLLQLNGRVTHTKMLNIPKILYWVVYIVHYLKCQLATTLKHSFKLKVYNDRANCFGSLGR